MFLLLNIVLDRVNGIDLDTIVEATNIINPILDQYDLISDEYIIYCIILIAWWQFILNISNVFISSF